MRYWVRIRMNQEDEDQEALEDEKHRDVNKSCLGRALKSFISLDSFHSNNILLGTALGIFLIIGKFLFYSHCKIGQIMKLTPLKNKTLLK